MDIQIADLVTVTLLVALEGLPSTDNAMVPAVLVLGAPAVEHCQAMHGGIAERGAKKGLIEKIDGDVTS